MEMLEVADRAGWRRWLARNHAQVSEVWRVFRKARAGGSPLAYDDSVEEALCFGWVDSLVRRLDESRYARKFTPRKPESRWSKSNRARAENMIRAGLMTPPGLALVLSIPQDTAGRLRKSVQRSITGACPALSPGKRNHRQGSEERSA